MLRHVPADRVRKPGPLAHQQQAGAMQHHHALLLHGFHGTKRMVGRLTASQIASASAASFFWRLT